MQFKDEASFRPKLLPHCVLKQGEDAPTLVNNLVALLAKITEENNGEDTKEDEDWEEYGKNGKLLILGDLKYSHE